MLTGSGDAIVVRIYGPDLEVLTRQGGRGPASSSAASTASSRSTWSSQLVDVPQVEVEVDLAAAQQYGLKPGDVRRAAATLMAGEEVGDIFRDGKAYDVVVWSEPAMRQSLTDIRELLIDTPGWRARPARTTSPTCGWRRRRTRSAHENLSRRLDVEANVRGRDLGSVVGDVERGRAAGRVPPRVPRRGAWASGPSARPRSSGCRLFAVVAAVGGLPPPAGVVRRNSRLAALVFLTLPSALVGGVLATSLSDRVISLGSLVGFLTVLGIAARNGIMMISHYQHLEREEGEAFGPGLVMRGAKERLAPILMTALATGLALVPLVVKREHPGS